MDTANPATVLCGVITGERLLLIAMIILTYLSSPMNKLLIYSYKCKEKFVILQSIGIIAINSSETRSVIYTCRYSSGHF